MELMTEYQFGFMLMVAVVLIFAGAMSILRMEERNELRRIILRRVKFGYDYRTSL